MELVKHLPQLSNCLRLNDRSLLFIHIVELCMLATNYNEIAFVITFNS